MSAGSAGSAFKISDNAFQWGKAYVDGLSKGTRDGLAEQEEYRKQAEFDARQAQQGIDNTRRASLDSRQASLDSSNLGFRNSEEGRRQQAFDERGSGAGTGKFTGGKSGIANLIVEEGRKRGYSNAAISGILGNFTAESTMNPNSINPDDRTASQKAQGGPPVPSVGLAQWNRERRTGLLNHAAEMGLQWKDPRAQVGWLYRELDTTHSSAKRALMGATNADRAADAFALLYERPQGAETGNANNVHNIGLRRSSARGALAFADQYSADNGVPSRQEREQVAQEPTSYPRQAQPLAPPPPITPMAPPAPVAPPLVPRRTQAQQDAAQYGGMALSPPATTGQVLDEFGKLTPPVTRFQSEPRMRLRPSQIAYDGSYMDELRPPDTSDPAYYTQVPEEEYDYGMI